MTVIATNQRRNPTVKKKKRPVKYKSKWTRKKKNEETMKSEEWKKPGQTSGQQVNRVWPEPGRETKSESKLPVTLSLHFHSHNYYS